MFLENVQMILIMYNVATKNALIMEGKVNVNLLVIVMVMFIQGYVQVIVTLNVVFLKLQQQVKEKAVHTMENLVNVKIPIIVMDK